MEPATLTLIGATGIAFIAGLLLGWLPWMTLYKSADMRADFWKSNYEIVRDTVLKDEIKLPEKPSA